MPENENGFIQMSTEEGENYQALKWFPKSWNVCLKAEVKYFYLQGPVNATDLGKCCKMLLISGMTGETSDAEI